MLPHLSPLNGGASAGAPVGVPPPPRFRPIMGGILEVDMNPSNPFKSRGRTAAQKAGLRYEDKIQDALMSRAKISIYFDSPILHFKDESGWRTCIPDGVDVFEDKVVLSEIKYQHTPDAWWQMRRLYEPLLRRFFPTAAVSLLEICRTYDPATPFPEVVRLVESYDNFARESKDGELGVYRWRA